MPGVASVSSNVISSNDIGISDSGGSGAVITDNQVTASTSLGIVVRTASGVQVGHNTTNFNGSGKPGDAGIALNGVTSSFFQNNQSEHNNGDGIFVDNISSGNQFLLNQLKFNALFDAEDQSLGAGTAGTANTWTQNLGNTSSPPGLVNSGGMFDARSRWGSTSNDALLMQLRLLSLKTPKPSGIP
jgi:hypothetical protein